MPETWHARDSADLRRDEDRSPEACPRSEVPGPEVDRVLALQRGAGNRAVASLLSGRVLQRSIGAGAKEGMMVKRLTDGVLFTIKRAGFDQGLGEWTYAIETKTGKVLIPASNRNFERVAAKDQFLAIAVDPSADFRQAVTAAGPDELNALVSDKEFLNRMRSTLTDERFGWLAAGILLISTYAPAGREEALRLLAIMYSDRGVAFRMLSKPVRTVIVPRDKQMTELDEFKHLLTGDGGKGPGKTFDGRWWAHTRGIGNVISNGADYAAITEENLLGGNPDPSVFDAPRGPPGTPGQPSAIEEYPPGYSTTTHEMAHAIHSDGLRGDQKKVIAMAYTKKRTATSDKATIVAPVWTDGPRVSPKAPQSWSDAGWSDDQYVEQVASLDDDARRLHENYASQDEYEYFAQATNAYFGTNTGNDATTEQPRNNGKAWMQTNEPELFNLLEELFKGNVVNELDADGTLKAGGTCTNPPPSAPPPSPSAQLVGTGPKGDG